MKIIKGAVLYAESSDIQVSIALILLMFVTIMGNECSILTMCSYSFHILLNYLQSDDANISNNTE